MRKAYWIFLVCMLLLAAFGVTAVVQGVHVYRNRPRLPTYRWAIWESVNDFRRENTCC